MRDNDLGKHVEPSNIKVISNAFQKCIDILNNQKKELVVNCQKLLQTVFNKELIINQLTETLID